MGQDGPLKLTLLAKGGYHERDVQQRGGYHERDVRHKGGTTSVTYGRNELSPAIVKPLSTGNVQKAPKTFSPIGIS